MRFSDFPTILGRNTEATIYAGIMLLLVYIAQVGVA